MLDAVTPGFLAQVGRDLVRSGDSMHVIDVDLMGRVTLLPCASWHFEGNAHPSTWTVRATVYGPSTSTTRHLPFAGVVFCKWGSTPGQPVRRDRTDIVGAHNRAAAERDGAQPCGRSGSGRCRRIQWSGLERVHLTPC